MKTLREITETLERIEHAKVSDSELLDLFRQLPPLALHVFEVGRDIRILRCRTHGGEFPNWKSELEISYVSNPELADYGRASLKGHSAFYGCIGRSSDEFEEARMLSIHETNRIIHDPTFEYEEEYAVVGNWNVLHPLNVVAIVQAEQLHGKNELLHAEFQSYLAALDATPIDKEGCIAFTTFLAGEFLKEVDRSSPENYKITAAFSHYVMERGLDGVAYPSARAEGASNTYNITLKPRAIDNNCKLKAVYGYRLIKEDPKSLIPIPFLGDTEVVGKFQWIDPGYMPRPDFIIGQLRKQRLLQKQAEAKG